MRELFALLIGISDFFPGPCSHGYPSLEGAASDAARMAILLRDQAGLKPENTRLLLSRFQADAGLAGPPNRPPTYENIVAAFEQLASAASPGDRVYVHYSGHGERISTECPEIKGCHGQDEALVPCDIAWPGSRYLRDWELSLLIGLLVDRGLVVTVVLDCCHAGGALQSGGETALPRSIGRNCALFAACRPDELAHEHPFEDREPRGVLSHWLFETLARHGLELSCGEVHQKLMARIRGSFPNQTPMFFGERERGFLSGDRHPPTRSVPRPMVLRVDETGRVLIDVGVPAGARVGDRMILRGASGEATAELAISQVGATESWADVIRVLGPGAIELGMRAEVLRLRQLGHLEKFRNILAVKNPQPAEWLEIGLEPGDEPSAGPVPSPLGGLDLPCGEATTLRIVNRSSLRLDFAVLDLAPDYSVAQLLPGRGSLSLLPLAPHQSEELRFQGWLPPGCDEGKHVLKVFATRGAADWRWLELPPLDRSAAPPARPATRGGLTPSEFPEEEWITAQMEIRVTR